jgi:branched-chain amino acid transport system substrate-binding protein
MNKKTSAFALCCVALALCLAMGTAGCGKREKTESDQKRSNEPIRIGVILPLTGEASSYGSECRRGIELAAAISAQPPELFFEDSKADPKQAVSALQKLIGYQRVTAIIGDMFSSTTLAIAPIAQQGGVVLLTPTAAAVEIPATGDHIFTIYPTSAFEGEFIANHVVQLGITNCGVVVQNVQAAQEIADAFVRSINSRGGQILFVKEIPGGTRDFRSVIAAIRSENPSAIFVSAYAQEACLFIQQAREERLNWQFFSQSTLYDQKLLSSFGAALEGIQFSAPFFNDEADTPEIRAFRTAYKERFDSIPNVWAAYGYDAASALILAYRSAASKGTPLATSLSEIQMNGATGPLSFNPDRTAHRSMRIFTVQGSKFVPFVTAK